MLETSKTGEPKQLRPDPWTDERDPRDNLRIAGRSSAVVDDQELAHEDPDTWDVAAFSRNEEGDH